MPDFVSGVEMRGGIEEGSGRGEGDVKVCEGVLERFEVTFEGFYSIC